MDAKYVVMVEAEDAEDEKKRRTGGREDAEVGRTRRSGGRGERENGRTRWT